MNRYRDEAKKTDSLGSTHFSRARFFLLLVFLLTFMNSGFPIYALAEPTSNKLKNRSKQPSKKDSSMIEVEVDAYSSEYSDFFSSQPKQADSIRSQQVVLPKISYSTSLAKQGRETKQKLIQLLSRLQADISADNQWIAETLVSKVDDRSFEIILVSSQEMMEEREDGSSFIRTALYFADKHFIKMSIDFFKNEIDAERIMRHELWHGKQRILYDLTPKDKTYPKISALPFNDKKDHEQFGRAIDADLRILESLKLKFEKQPPVGQPFISLTDFPSYTLRIKASEKEWQAKGINQVGDLFYHPGSFIMEAFKIEKDADSTKIHFRTTHPLYALLAYYNDILSVLSSNYNFELPDLKWLIKFQKKHGYEFKNPQWLAEFDAYIQGVFPPAVRQQFLPNREKYHWERAARIEELLEPPVLNLLPR